MQKLFVANSNLYLFAKHFDLSLLPVILIYQWHLPLPDIFYLPLFLNLPHVLIAPLLSSYIQQVKSRDVLLTSVLITASTSILLYFIESYSVFLFFIFIRSSAKVVYQPAIHQHIAIYYKNMMFYSNKTRESWGCLSALCAVALLSILLKLYEPSSLLLCSGAIYFVTWVMYLFYFRMVKTLNLESVIRTNSKSRLVLIKTQVNNLFYETRIRFLTIVSFIMPVFLFINSLVLPRIAFNTGFQSSVFVLMSGMYYIGGFLCVLKKKIQYRHIIVIWIISIIAYASLIVTVYLSLGKLINVFLFCLFFLTIGYGVNGFHLRYLTTLHFRFTEKEHSSIMLISNALTGTGVLLLPLLGDLSINVTQILSLLLLFISVVLLSAIRG